jgi:hypothetical protein
MSAAVQEDHSHETIPAQHLSTDGGAPPPEVLKPIMRNVEALIQDIKDSGAWVFNGGLHAPSTATVARLRDGEVLVTDGPYLEGKEHIGGFVIIKAPDPRRRARLGAQGGEGHDAADRGAAVPGRGRG